jgi:hypothetical protein
MPSTYEPIATTTLASAVASYTFSSIPQTYTDLILVTNVKGSSASGYPAARFNSDSGTNYSTTFFYGVGGGTSGTSGRSSNANYAYTQWNATFSTSDFNFNNIIQIQNYSNTTTNKTYIARAGNAAVSTDINVGLWRSTSAISTISYHSLVGDLAIGTTLTLYGIAAA